MNSVDIQNIKNAIAKNLHERFGDVEVWRQKEYEDISQLIYEKTKLKLSYMTLKRIFGKVEYHFSPNKTTLNALAQFLDYHNWDDFVQSHAASSNVKVKKSFSVNSTRLQKIGLTLSVILVGAVLFFFLINDSTQQPLVDVRLSTTTPIIEAPGVVEFTYDLSKIKEDSVYIRFGNESYKTIEFLPKESKMYMRNLKKLGVYKVYIGTPAILYDSLKVLLIGKHWERYLSYIKNNNPVLSMMPQPAEEDSILYISQNELRGLNIDTTQYFQVDYSLFDTLPISMDDFTIETRIKNDLRNKKYLSSSFAALKIYSEHSSIKINFTDENSYQNAFFFISDNRQSGSYKNYKSLGIDLFEWHTVKMVVKNNTAKLYVDDIEHLSTNYTKPLGCFYGIQFNFSQIGMIDYVKLFNNKGELVYTDGF